MTVRGPGSPPPGALPLRPAEAQGAAPAEEAPAPPAEAVAPEAPTGEDARAFAEAQVERAVPLTGASPLATRLGSVAASTGPDADSQLDDAQGTLDSGAMYTTGPGGGSVAPADEPGGGIYPSGRSLDGSFAVARDGGATTTASAGSGRGAFYGDVTTADGQRARSFGVYAEGQWWSVSHNVAWASSGGVAGVGGWLGTGGSDLAASMSANRTVGGLTVAGGAVGSVGFDRSASLLGDYTGTEPSLVGKKQVELKRSLSGSTSGFLGLLTGSLGVAGYLGPSKGKSVTYRTFLDEGETRDLVFEDHGLRRALKDRAKGMGLSEERLQVPDLSRPETLRLGDEVVASVSGGVSGALFVGALGFGAGVQGTLSGDFELAVKRHPDDVMEVVLTPSRVTGVQLRAEVPLVFDFDVGQLEARSLRQGFVFDLKTPSGRAAYAQALKGQLPGGLPEAKKTLPTNAASPDDPAALETHLEQVVRDERLPRGVARTLVEVGRLKRKASGVSVGWGSMMRGTTFFGLGAQRIASEASSTRLAAGSTDSTSTRGVDHRYAVLLSGNESIGVFGALKRTSHLTPEGARQTSFGGLTLRLQLQDTKVRSDELDDEVIAKLNEVLNLDLAPSDLHGRKQSLQVTAERTLSAEDLDELGRAPVRRWRDVADEVGLREREALGLREALVELDPFVRAEAIQDFLSRHHTRGLGLLARLLPAGAPFAVTSTSSAYTGPRDLARDVALEFAAPLSPDATNRDLNHRFERVMKLLKDARAALDELDHDPLLDDAQRAEHRKHLEQAVRVAEAAGAVDHLGRPERVALADRLEAGWTTAHERRIIDHLLADHAT